MKKNRRFPIPAYFCIVFPDGDFYFSYKPTHGLTELKTPNCGPITNTEHFEKIQTMFEHHASVLAKYD